MDHDSLYHRLFSHPLLVEQARQLPTGHRLPSVLSVALQNGNRPWRAVQQVEDLIDLPASSPLWSKQPNIRYHSLDMGRFPADA